MQQRIIYSNCPVCYNSHIHKVLTVKDHSVSNEDFEIWECKKCTFRFTQNIPAVADIAPYYQSSAYISHSDTSKGFINRLYHIVRGFTLKSKKNIAEKYSGINKGSLLDIGAGTGAFVHTMQDAGWNVTGIEPDDAARKNALDIRNVKLKPADELTLLPAGSFNVITLWHVLEHVHDLHTYMETFRKLLAAKGTLIIALPNYTCYDAHVYAGAWAAYDVPRHLWHFSPGSFDTLAAHHGFSVIHKKPMWFDSYYISLLSEKYLSGKSNTVKAFITGSVSNMKAFTDTKRCSSVIYILQAQV